MSAAWRLLWEWLGGWRQVILTGYIYEGEHQKVWAKYQPSGVLTVDRPTGALMVLHPDGTVTGWIRPVTWRFA